MEALAVIVLIVFAVTYVIIATEKVNKTGMSLLGLALIGMIFWISSLGNATPQITFGNLIQAIPWTTILFIVSMMIVVAVAESSGMFQYLAVRLAQVGGGDSKSLLRTFLLFVWIVSLVLPRTTTMTIMVPITIQICRALNIDFKPFLISQSLVCNIGSIPSVVADAPNIIITDETGLNAGFLFVSFMPLSFILLIVTWFSILYLFRGSFDVTDQDNIELLRGLNPTTMIKSKQDFYASILAFGVMIAGFILGPSLRIESAMVALFAAAVLLIVAHERAGEFMSKVGWNTVFFLIGVFGLVEGLKAVGLIEELGTALETVIGNSIVTVIILMVWVPACLSPILSNDPVAVVFAPLALKFIPLTPFVPLALILGINLAGNLFTPLGSPANMVVMEYSEKEGNPVTLADFAKIGTITGLINLTIGSLWLLMLSSLLV